MADMHARCDVARRPSCHRAGTSNVRSFIPRCLLIHGANNFATGLHRKRHTSLSAGGVPQSLARSVAWSRASGTCKAVPVPFYVPLPRTCTCACACTCARACTVPVRCLYVHVRTWRATALITVTPPHALTSLRTPTWADMQYAHASYSIASALA
jgi:hypothetical protein